MLQTDLRYKLIDISLGYSFQFVHSQNCFMLNTSPYTEPKLAPIDAIDVGTDSMQFNAPGKSQTYNYRVDFGQFSEAPIIADLIQKTNAGQGFNLALPSNNDIEYFSEQEDEAEGEDGGISLRLSNSNSESIRIFVPLGRIIHLKDKSKFPVELVNCLEGTVCMDANTVQFSGRNVKDESDFKYCWELDFPESIAGFVRSLVEFVCTVSKQ